MFGCKFCGVKKDDVFQSKSDRNLCKDCYKDIAKYRRITVKTCKLEPHEKAFVDRMQKAYAEALERGDRIIRREGVLRHCVTCGNEFGPTTVKRCDACYRRQAAYYSLHNYNSFSPKLREYDDFYHDQAAKGFTVPKLFWDRHNCKK